MSWRLVEGVPLPDAVGGHVALDFCNTRAGWGEPAPKEYLTTPGVLALWARENGLVPAAREPEPTRGACAGRSRCGRRCTGAPRAGARTRTGIWSRRRRRRPRRRPCSAGRRRRCGLVPAGGRGHAGRRAASGRPGRGGPPDLGSRRLRRRLPRVGCGWLFADRRRRRRWCSMAACGNRAKARRYAERHGARPEPPAVPGGHAGRARLVTGCPLRESAAWRSDGVRGVAAVARTPESVVTAGREFLPCPRVIHEITGVREGGRCPPSASTPR